MPDEVMREILDAGRLAPTSGNEQNFCFGVVRDGSVKRELAQAAGQEWIASAPVVIAHCVRLVDLATLPADDLTIRVNRARFGQELLNYLNNYPDRRTMNVLWRNCDSFLPGEHVLLAAVDHGLAGCWIGYLDIQRASEILRLPEDMVCLYLMPLGYPAVSPEEKSTRPIEECVFYDRWDRDPPATDR